MDVNILGKFYDMTLLIRLLFGVEIFRVVGVGKSGPDTGQNLQRSVKFIEARLQAC